MTKPFRQGRIAEILRQRPVQGQDELSRKLRAARIRVSQATLSRDLHEMGIVRGPEGYLLPEDAGDRSGHLLREEVHRALRENVRFVAPASSLVVIRTDPGHAHPLGIALDRSGWNDIVGTIAGDDTLFLATHDAPTAGRLAHRIRTLLA